MHVGDVCPSVGLEPFWAGISCAQTRTLGQALGRAAQVGGPQPEPCPCPEALVPLSDLTFLVVPFNPLHTPGKGQSRCE